MEDRFIADQLAAFAIGTTFEEIPAERIRATALLLLDSLGLALSASREGYAESAAKLASTHWHGSGDCTVIGMGGGYATPAATFANGVLIHSQDYDDTHPESLVHASGSVAAAAFALAEAHAMSGRELLRIGAIGYEVAARAGLGASPGAQMHMRGFQGSAIAGAIAVSAMAAAAARLDQHHARHALALSTSVASGIIECVRDGSFAKAVQPGWAAQGGLWAATAAAAGITGPREAFEGPFGMYQAFAGLDLCDVGRVTRELGNVWETSTIEFKLYPYCHFLQAPVDAALSIRDEAHISDLSEVARAEVTLAPGQEIRVCVPVEERLAPTSEYSVRFSLFYSVAMGLAGCARSFDDFSGALVDKSIRELAKRVTYVAVDTPTFPRRMPGSLQVTMRDGRRFLRTYESPPGPFGRPVEDEEVVDKYQLLASPVLGADRARRLAEKVLRLSDEPDVSFLAETVPVSPERHRARRSVTA